MTRQPEIHKKPARRAEATHKTPKANPVAPQALPSKLNQLEAMLNRPVGASIADMVATTGWRRIRSAARWQARSSVVGTRSSRRRLTASAATASVTRDDAAYCDR